MLDAESSSVRLTAVKVIKYLFFPHGLTNAIKSIFKWHSVSCSSSKVNCSAYLMPVRSFPDNLQDFLNSRLTYQVSSTNFRPCTSTWMDWYQPPLTVNVNSESCCASTKQEKPIDDGNRIVLGS